MHGFMHRFTHRFGRRFGHRFLPEGKQLTLAQMAVGQSGVVIEILGGRSMTDRLSNLGIRPGKRVTKVGSMFMRGPVTIELGNSQLALGFGMANKIKVELD